MEKIQTKGKFSKLLGPKFTYVSNGHFEFNGYVADAMDKVHLWDNMIESYIATSTDNNQDVNYFITTGSNASYFKTDGQRYCVHLHIQKGNECYLETCLCAWYVKEIPALVERYKALVEKFLEEGIDFNEKIKDKLENYPWQTSVEINRFKK